MKLQEALAIELEGCKLNWMSSAREELTERYRAKSGSNKSLITTDAHRYAYIATRMPATFAVIKRVLNEIPNNNCVKSLLDLGAGPGTAMWAASEVLPAIERIDLIEKDRALAAIGKRLATHNTHAVVQGASWHDGDLERLTSLPASDLIVLSYTVGELAPSAIQPLLDACWQACGEYLVVIEPGTPAGFERIRAIRSHLIGLGAHMVAPCPHTLPCPMSGSDWCHFSERVERSVLHRRLKGGSLGYEDEKYSYVVVSKSACALPPARILRHPQKRSGHVLLRLCTAHNGLQDAIVSKRTPEAYREARKAEWGDRFLNY